MISSSQDGWYPCINSNQVLHRCNPRELLLHKTTSHKRLRNVVKNVYTGYTQKNGAVSKDNKKFISQLNTGTTYAVSSSGLETTHLPGASFLNRARNSRFTVITDLDTSKRSTQKAFSCCDAILETGPAAPQ